MADTTYAVKVNEDVRERLQKLVEDSGQSSKDFFADMVSQFELMNARKQVPVLAADIDELVKLTTRINNIFINVGERVLSMQESQQLEFKNEVKEKENLIGLLQKQIETLNHELAQREERVASALNDAKEALEAKKAVDKLKRENEKLNDLLAEKETQLQTIEENHKARIDDLAQKHVEAMERQKEKSAFEQTRALLEQKEQYTRELVEVREVYQERMSQLIQSGSKPKKDAKKKPEPKAEAPDK